MILTEDLDYKKERLRERHEKERLALTYRQLKEYETLVGENNHDEEKTNEKR